MESVIAHSEQQHVEIVDAIKRRDADGARAARCTTHVSGTASYLRGFLQ